MFVTVDPTLMPLEQAKPALQIEIVADLIHFVPTREQAWLETAHYLGQVLVKGIALGHKALDQFLELGLTLGAITLPFGSRVPAISWISSTCFRSTSCSGLTASKPLSMQPAKRLSCSSGNPLFSRPSFVGSSPEPHPKPPPSANRADEAAHPDRR